LPPAHNAKGFTEVAMSGRIFWIEADRPANPLHREIMAAALLSDDPKEMQSVGMVRLRREDLAVKRLGFREPPCLVALKRDLKHLRYRHGLALGPSLSHTRFSVMGFVGNGVNSGLLSFP
jgi:hypothetical protein